MIIIPTKDDVERVYKELDISDCTSNYYSLPYNNFWDFGKSSDEYHSGITTEINTGLFFEFEK